MTLHLTVTIIAYSKILVNTKCIQLVISIRVTAQLLKYVCEYVVDGENCILKYYLSHFSRFSICFVPLIDNCFLKMCFSVFLL